MSRSIRYPNHAPRPWPQARPEPTAHIEAEFAHGTGSWPAPTFRFGLAHACGRTTRLRQHASRAGVAATATHPSATTSASSARAGVMATSFANGFSGRFGSVTRRQPSLPFPTSPPVLQPGADPQQDAPGDESQQAPEGECQQAPADECQKAQDVRPSQLHCRTCRLISSYRLGAHYTLRPVTHGPASLKRGISNSTYGAIRSHFASQQTIGCAGKWRASTPPGTEGQSDAGRPRRLRQHASRQNPVHLFVDRPAQHANRCRDAHSPCTMRPSAIAPMRGRGSPGRRPVRHAAKEARTQRRCGRDARKTREWASVPHGASRRTSRIRARGSRASAAAPGLFACFASIGLHMREALLALPRAAQAAAKTPCTCTRRAPADRTAVIAGGAAPASAEPWSP